VVAREVWAKTAQTWKMVAKTMEELKKAKCDREKVLKVKLGYLKQAQSTHQLVSALTKERCNNIDSAQADASASNSTETTELRTPVPTQTPATVPTDGPTTTPTEVPTTHSPSPSHSDTPTETPTDEPTQTPT